MSISPACTAKGRKKMVARINPSRSYNRRMNLCHNRMDRNSAYNLLGHVIISIAKGTRVCLPVWDWD